LSHRGWRTAAVVTAILLLTGVVWDLSRRPEDQWGARVLLVGIDLYQAVLSPHMETAGVRCRFTPTCSNYAEAVIRQEGALKGSWRAAGRIVRCGPWTPAGTQDPP